MEQMKDWQAARETILERLHAVQLAIAREDEGSALELVNQQDEFCDLARARKEECNAGKESPFCFFCEGFMQTQGCLDHLARINAAVTSRRWGEATRKVEEYSRWLKDLVLTSPA